jgi:hypothetical protein
MSMDLSTLGILGQVTGVAGVAIGAFVYIARDLIAKNIFPKLTRAQSYPIILVFAFMAWTVALAGIGAWAYIEVNKNKNGVIPEQSTSTNLAIPGETGWIFGGYFNTETKAFIEGPYVSIYDSKTRGLRKYVEVGDTIQLKVSRKIIIVDFKTTGTSQKLVSPINVGIIGEEDETGIILPKDTRLVVREVSEGKWPDSKNEVV